MFHAVLQYAHTISVLMHYHFSNYRNKRRPGSVPFAIRVLVSRPWRWMSMTALFVDHCTVADFLYTAGM